MIEGSIWNIRVSQGTCSRRTWQPSTDNAHALCWPKKSFGLSKWTITLSKIELFDNYKIKISKIPALNNFDLSEAILNNIKSLCDGSLSEAVFAVTPMETVKVKFVNDQMLPKPRYKGFIKGLSMIVREEGFRHSMILHLFLYRIYCTHRRP
uniref:Citrate transport protein n=1 Tax=Parascaris equorum TaxID=6256 RepID=A0A914RQI4_PAREQ